MQEPQVVAVVVRRIKVLLAHGLLAQAQRQRLLVIKNPFLVAKKMHKAMFGILAHYVLERH
jgi:hypothetical protein